MPSLASQSFAGLALKIEGVGTTLGQYRLSTCAAPGWDADALYLPTLISWPDEIGVEVDFLSGEARQTSGRFRVRQTTTTRAALYDVVPVVVAEAESAVGQSSTSILTDTTTLAGTVIHWGREAILLGTHAGSGTYTGCTRGALGTQATRHGDGAQPDLELYARPWSLKGRIVELVRIPADAVDYADEVLLWTGVLHEVSAEGLSVLVVEARDGLSLLSDVKLGLGAATWTATRPGSPQRPIAGYGSDPDDMRCVVVEESSGRVSVVGYRSPLGSPTPGYRLDLGSIAPVGYFPLPDEGARYTASYREVITTHAAQPASSATPGDDTLPLSQSPAELVLQLLTTTANANTPGGNGDYDLGIAYLAGSIPARLIDQAAVLEWGRRRAPYLVDNLWIGLDGPEQLLDVIAKILRPLGAALVVGRAGLLTVAQLADAPTYNDADAITQDQIVTVSPVQRRAIPTSIDAVEVTLDLVPGLGTATQRTLDVRQSYRLPPGSRSTLEVDATAYLDPQVARAGALALLLRYRLQPPAVSLEVLPTADYWPGDVVRVTCPSLLGPDGAGVTDEPALVVGRQYAVEGPEMARGGAGRASLRLSLLMVGFIHKNQGLIAPSGVVSSYNAGTKTITLQANAYASTTNPYLATDRAGFAAGDVIQVCDQYGTVITATATIASVGTNTITLTASPATAPTGGNVVRVAAWSSAASAQRAKWAFVADADDEVGGSTTNAYTYPVG
jgi:hypothetical protein